MAHWSESRIARIGVRVAGLAALLLAWEVGKVLWRHVHAHAPRQASMGELGLCALLMLLWVVGHGLFIIGPALWKQVEVPGRRSLAMPPLVEPSL